MFTQRHSHSASGLAGHVTGSLGTGVLEETTSLSMSPTVRKTLEAQTSTLGGPALLEGYVFLSLMGAAPVLEPLIPHRDIEAPLLPFAHPSQAWPDLSQSQHQHLPQVGQQQVNMDSVSLCLQKTCRIWVVSDLYWNNVCIRNRRTGMDGREQN